MAIIVSAPMYRGDVAGGRARVQAKKISHLTDEMRDDGFDDLRNLTAPSFGFPFLFFLLYFSRRHILFPQSPPPQQHSASLFVAQCMEVCN